MEDNIIYIIINKEDQYCLILENETEQLLHFWQGFFVHYLD